MSQRGLPQPGRRRFGRLGCGDEAHAAGGSARRRGAARAAAGARASSHGVVFGRVELNCKCIHDFVGLGSAYWCVQCFYSTKPDTYSPLFKDSLQLLVRATARQTLKVAFSYRGARRRSGRSIHRSMNDGELRGPSQILLIRKPSHSPKYYNSTHRDRHTHPVWHFSTVRERVARAHLGVLQGGRRPS